MNEEEAVLQGCKGGWITVCRAKSYASPVIKERASRNDSSDRLKEDFLPDPIRPN